DRLPRRHRTELGDRLADVGLLGLVGLWLRAAAFVGVVALRDCRVARWRRRRVVASETATALVCAAAAGWRGGASAAPLSLPRGDQDEREAQCSHQASAAASSAIG